MLPHEERQCLGHETRYTHLDSNRDAAALEVRWRGGLRGGADSTAQMFAEGMYIDFQRRHRG